MVQVSRARICSANYSGDAMSGLETEGLAFVQACLSGMIVYSGYYCIRKLRRVWKHNLLAIAVEDIIFWIMAAIFLFMQMYRTSDGSIRWYFVVGVVLGAGILFLLQRKIERFRKR